MSTRSVLGKDRIIRAGDAEIARLGPWFHNLHLPDGRQTAPHHFLGDFPLFKWQKVSSLLPEDLRGWRALDIGCNAGFYSIELARRGAQVLGIDREPLYLKQAAWAIRKFGVKDQISLKYMQVYDLIRLKDKFDLILFMGVFYHLRYPLLGLDITAEKVRRLLVFQSLTIKGRDEYKKTRDQKKISDTKVLDRRDWPKMAFIEHRFVGDPTNWWIPNHAGVRAMLRSSGLRVLQNSGDIYLCEPDPKNPSCLKTWNASEVRAATGRSWR